MYYYFQDYQFDSNSLLLSQQGQLLVRDDEDRQRLLEVLRDAAREHGLAIHAYVLLDTRLYLLATPRKPDALSLSMQALGRRYVASFNRRHHRQGGLWAGRYRSTIVDPARYLFQCMMFIELHPELDGTCLHARDYAWSSAFHHLGRRSDPLITDHVLFWSLGNTPFERQAARGEQRRPESGNGLNGIRLILHGTPRPPCWRTSCSRACACSGWSFTPSSMQYSKVMKSRGAAGR